jgi:hypothetical protein
LARNWYKRVPEHLLCEIGSSIRQQIRDVCWSGGGLDSAFDGWLDAKQASQKTDPRPHPKMISEKEFPSAFI